MSDLSSAEKLVFVYLLTNERVNIIHCYECPDRTILFETGVSRDQLESAKRKLEATGKAFFHEGYVYLSNADKYEQYNGPLNDAAKHKLEKEMAASIFDWYKANRDTPFKPPSTPLDTPLKGTRNHKSEIINKNEGGAGETTANYKHPDYLLNLPDDDLATFAQEFDLSPQSVKRKAASLHDWYLGNPRKNHRENWKAVLRNALRADSDKLREDEKKKLPPIIIDPM